MSQPNDLPLTASLALMRLATGAFLLVWSVEKIVAPDVARRVFAGFYSTEPSDALLAVVGLAQTALVVAFMLGLLRFWTYGLVTLMHGVSVAVTLPQLVTPFTFPHHIFWAGVPVLALMIALFALRERDELLTVPRRLGRLATG